MTVSALLPAVTSRLRPALRAAAWHVSLSLAVAALVAFLVFGFWFPDALRHFGWQRRFVLADCGRGRGVRPAAHAGNFNPAKPRAELVRDLALVAAIQLLALGYGVHTLSYARPVAVVYEVDRFRVVSFADLDADEAEQIPDWAQPWRFSRPRTVGIRASNTGVQPAIDQRRIPWHPPSTRLSGVSGA